MVPLRRGIGGSGGSHTKSEISFDTLRLVSADTDKSNDALKYIDLPFLFGLSAFERPRSDSHN